MAEKPETNTLPVQQILVTAGPSAPLEGTIINTPPGQSDLQVIAVSRWNQVWIRTARAFAQSLVGNLTSVGASVVVVVKVFGLDLPLNGFLATVYVALGLTLTPTLVAFLQNAIEILNNMDKTAARFRA